ncbi:MAG: septum formation initiator family protein [Muribaculaceae bacterium]|nr:septum formation initiator family protein [Muribaculaceae bacterium]
MRRFLSPVTLACLLVIGYIVFSGENTVFRSIDYDRTIDSLRAELDANRDTMLYYRDLNRRLASDRELMEQVVREQYGMKRASEDVYIFNEIPPSIEE